MVKKIILLVASVAIISIAFMIYQSRESSAPVAPPPERQRPSGPTTRRSINPPRPTTQSAMNIDAQQAKAFELTGAHIPAGGGATFHVFDPKTGRQKYLIRAQKWEPVGPSGNEFAVTEPSAEVLLPRGQMAYVRADYGQITVARGAKNQFEPKRGWFKGNVRMIVDRTKPEEREAHPDKAAPVNHPEAVIKFWLEDVRFDLELANLFSDGPLRMESADGTLEGRGLELLWNETNRRVTKLRIAEGGKATLRSSNLLDFGAGGGPGKGKSKDQAGAETKPATGDQTEAVADATTPPTPPATPVDPQHPRGNAPFNLVDVQAPPDKLKENRIDIYHLVFRDNIVAEQRSGMKAVGGLKASMIEVLFEVGQSEREAAQHAPGTQPAQKTPKANATSTAPAEERTPLSAGSTVVISWRGELMIVPEEEESPEQQKVGKAERIHLTATGNPVELFSRETGQAVCDKLEYHDETKQAWLTGTPERPIHLANGPEAELIGEKVFFDGKNGVARVDGPGRLEFKRQKDEGGAPLSLGFADAGKKAADAKSPTTAPADRAPTGLTWKKSAEMHFGLASVPAADQAGAEGPISKDKYLKDAVFEGEVKLNDPNQSMSAEHVEVAFRKPTTAGDFSRDKVVAERITAQGGVRMAGEDNQITCDSLVIDLTVDEFGNNVPSIGRAVKNVLARQGQRMIAADDYIEIHLASVPRPITPEERAKMEARAKEAGITPDSPEWKKALEARQRRVRTVVVSLNAKGGVEVRDPNAKLEVLADDLECVMNNEQQITKATIIGQVNKPAHVQTRDFEIRGPRVLMDVATQSAKVPGAGLLRFFTSQDLDGRPVDKPVPVVVTWTTDMWLDGVANEGSFIGAVRASSESSTLDCNELALNFQDLPKPAREPEGVRSFWAVRPFLNSSHRKEKGRQGSFTTTKVAGQLRKRLSYLRADGATSGEKNGAAHMELKAYDQTTPKTVIGRVATAMVPTWLQDPTKVAKTDTQRRLVSGAAVSGPRIVVDLVQEQLAVQGKGFLLIRDYRVPARRGRDAGQPSDKMADALSSDSLTNLSPGHTGFTWLNGMSFLNKKNVAVFDREVRMEHRSGSELAMSAELAAVTGLDAKTLAAIKGRHVEMTSDHLLAEFERLGGRTPGMAESGTLSRATRLKIFVAAGRVHIGEGGRSLDAAEVSYHDNSGLVRATGTARANPRVEEIDLATGQRKGGLTGKAIEWNIKTGDIQVQDVKVNAMGR